MSRARVALVVIVLIAAGEGALLRFLAWRAREGRAAGRTPIERGRAVAEASGCFACHGPGGGQPIANPGARSGEVPGWTGGTWMMWNKTNSDVRAWIEDGHPPGRSPDTKALIHMPAFGSRIGKADMDDLVGYVLAVSQFGEPPDEAVGAGKEVAAKNGCFGCHGPEGRGVLRNVGSFKGYIPPWDGDDYPDLVRGDAEFREWVRNGISERFKANPAARAFLERQAIAMPAYGDRVSDDDLKALAAYVAWVRRTPRAPAGSR